MIINQTEVLQLQPKKMQKHKKVVCCCISGSVDRFVSSDKDKYVILPKDSLMTTKPTQLSNPEPNLEWWRQQPSNVSILNQF